MDNIISNLRNRIKDLSTVQGLEFKYSPEVFFNKDKVANETHKPINERTVYLVCTLIDYRETAVQKFGRNYNFNINYLMLVSSNLENENFSEIEDYLTPKIKELEKALCFYNFESMTAKQVSDKFDKNLSGFAVELNLSR